MFQWSYFIIFVFLGFVCGYTNPNVPAHRRKPIGNFFWLAVLVTVIAAIVNFATFGFFWGLLTVIEVSIGYFIGRKISVGDSSDV